MWYQHVWFRNEGIIPSSILLFVRLAHFSYKGVKLCLFT